MGPRSVRLAALAATTGAILLTLAAVVTTWAGPPLLPDQPSQPDRRILSTSAGPFLWSSGWVSIQQTEVRCLNHNLGRSPEDYVVDLFFRDRDGGLGIHRQFYGGADQGNNEYGAHWLALDSNRLCVFRWENDTGVDDFLARVRVSPTAPDYDSGWVSIQAGQTLTVMHGLAHSATDLTVGMWFSSTQGLIHHIHYGGLARDRAQTMSGVYWHNLTDSTVQVTRYAGDTAAQQVRVTVARSIPPAYDSFVAMGGWQPIAAGALITFTHNLHTSAEWLLYRAECYSSDTALGIHQAFAGGEYDWRSAGWVGMNLQNMTMDAVTAYRHAQDTVCPQMRVVVYVVAARVHLPLLLRGHSVAAMEAGSH